MCIGCCPLALYLLVVSKRAVTSIYVFVYLTQQCWRYLQGSRCCSPERPAGGAVQLRPVGGQNLCQRGAE